MKVVTLFGRVRSCKVMGTAYKPSLGKRVPVCKRYV